MTLTLGVIGSSAKENEWRLPIHPAHVERIDADLRDHIYLEHGYGERYGVSDEHLSPLVAGMLSKEQLIASSDILLMPKPTHSDVGPCVTVRCSGGGRIACKTPSSRRWRSTSG